METANVAGVRFRNAGKIAYYYTAGLRLETGEYVVVETTRGPELAKVVIAPGQVVVNELNVDELPPILRLATDDDLRKADALRARADEILPAARQLAAETNFPSRIDSAEFTLDGRRVTFSFTSEERLDYREFLRKASERFGVRVDMRQLGARDRARLAGGYGICGRELCCSNWLTSFPSISIKMAKEQDLALNPQKISGLCGRLLCCLSYEEEGYREMRRTLPRMGQRCSTPTGEGKVIGLNILRRQVKLLVPEVGVVEVGDRDLGTVVRWDTSSKSAEPPPSISRVDAIAQGLIEADEQDLREAEGGYEPEPEPFDRPGRGRLPQRQQTRRLPLPRRPEQPEPSREPAAREPRGQRQRSRPAARRGEPGTQQQSQPQAPRGQRPQSPPQARPSRSEPPQLPGASRSFQRSRPPAVERPERPTPPPPPAPRPPRAEQPPAGEGGGDDRQPGARRRNRGRGRGPRPSDGESGGSGSPGNDPS